MPQISVIVPVYNAERYLHRCVDSILSQTFSDFELLLINDGSKDSSGAICDEYAAKDPRVRVFHKENGGVSNARNTGLKEANSEFILFLDSDDRYTPDCIQTLISLELNNDFDCIIFGIKQDSGSDWSPKENTCYKSVKELLIDYSELLDSELLSPCVNKLYKKNLVYNNFNENISYGEDLVFCLDYLSNCQKIYFTKLSLYLRDDTAVGSLVKTFNSHRLSDIEFYQKRIVEFSGSENNYVIKNYLSHKYIRDLVKQLQMIFLQKNLSLRQKKQILESWRKDSFLINVKPIWHGTDFIGKFMLLCIKFNIPSIYNALLKCRHLIK